MNLTPTLAGLAFAAFSGWLMRHALKSYRHAVASHDWPTVTGRMTKVVLWGKRRVDGEMRDVSNLSVKYRYTVDGEEHEGTAVSFFTLVYPETTAFADAHPEGSEVTVFHDPRDPGRAVLIPGPRAGNKRYSDLIIAGMGLAAAVAVTVSGAMGWIG